MAWRDALSELKRELAQVREERQRQFAEGEAELQRQRDELSQLANSLGISALLAQMNDTLLDGHGEVETVVSWEPEEDDDDEDDLLLDVDEEEADVISAILSWDEGGEREVSIDLGLTVQGTYLQVNGVDIRPEREALEPALLQAFRDELEV